MAVCGAGCMGFVNVARGLRAIGYTEPDPLPAGPVALVTHSGSVFSALLRTRRAFGFTLAVSSGQELVTPAAAYARYALTLPETKVARARPRGHQGRALLRAVLADAAARDVPVVLLAAGTSAASRSLVAAHSGALAAGDGAWQALASAYGVHRVGDLAELADTLELFCLAGGWPVPPAPLGSGRRRRRRHATAATARRGDAWPGRESRPCTTPGSSGRTSPTSRPRSASRSRRSPRRRGSGWRRSSTRASNPATRSTSGGPAATREALFTEALSALADDASVGAVALAVDLVPEYDGDDSYRDAVLAAAAKTDKPVAVLASIPAAIDTEAATRLRAAGVPVLESTRTGLLALRHLLAHAPSPGHPPRSGPATTRARPRASTRRAGDLSHAASPASRSRVGQRVHVRCGRAGRAGSPRSPRARSAAPTSSPCSATTASPPSAPARPPRWRGRGRAAAAIGYPVALKTDEPDIAHKSDVGGVRLSIADPAALAAAYQDLSARLGPRVTVSEMAAPGRAHPRHGPRPGPRPARSSSAPAESWPSTCPSARSPSRRSPGRRRAPDLLACAWPTSWPASAASHRATSTRDRRASSPSRSWWPTSASTSTPSTSTR